MVTQYVLGEVGFGACVLVTCPPAPLLSPGHPTAVPAGIPQVMPPPTLAPSRESASYGLDLGLQRYGQVFAK